MNTNSSKLKERLINLIESKDMSVLACCNYSYKDQKIADSYLNVSIVDIIKLRKINEFCRKCRSLSLHRYFDPVYYSDFVEKIIEQNENK